MNVHPLVKIPCLLLAAAGLHVAFTAPNPPASAESRPPISSLADRFMRAMLKIHSLEYAKACFWFSALAESAVIVANAYPSLPISKIILEKLLFGGNGSQIRLTTAAVAGTALGIGGGALRAWCYRELGKYFTFEMSIMKDHQLVTTGPYRIVRHPSYTGGIMFVPCVFLLHATQGSWVRESGVLRYLSAKIAAGIFTFIVAMGLPYGVLWRMMAEDRVLRRQFGDKWDAWAARVRYMIIPGIL